MHAQTLCGGKEKRRHTTDIRRRVHTGAEDSDTWFAGWGVEEGEAAAEAEALSVPLRPGAWHGVGKGESLCGGRYQALRMMAHSVVSRHRNFSFDAVGPR